MTSGAMLVTALGIDPKPARYALADRSVESPLAPLALAQLLDRRPSRVLALCTVEAKERSWPILQRGLNGLGVEAAAVDLGADVTDVTSFVRIVASGIPADGAPDGLMIDATHGFRHYAVLTYLTIQYLSALRGVDLRGAFYGLWRPIDEGPSPFLDLRPLLALPDWIHALRVFEDAGDASTLATTIERDGDQAAQTVAKGLREISEARAAGLPLELGQTSASFRAERKKPFKRALAARGALLEEELWRRLEEPLKQFGFDRQTDQTYASGWKGRIALGAEEMKRQAALVDDLLARGSIAVALGLMNEWTVSRAVLQMGKEGSWLDLSARRAAAAALGALGELDRDQALGRPLTDAQRELGRFWRDLSDLRNAFHHHGMRRQVLVGAGANDVASKLGAVRSYWGSLKTLSDLALSPPFASERLLVSPLGRRPGVLFSAVEACRRDGRVPDACLVVVSDETLGAAGEALRHAGFEGPVHQVRISDPYGGQSEIERLVREARGPLADAREIAVNLTGGTTLMGLAVAAIANEGQRLARDVRRFGLVDRRPPRDQDADPYRAGDAFWLDPRSTDGD